MKLEELKEGMYVKTLLGNIYKIQDEEFEIKQSAFTGDILYKKNNEFETITKASHNTIDLIEVGDILLIKDFVDEACTIFTDIYYIQNENQLFNIKRDLEKNKNMKISKILTKEQFESMAYEVE